MRVSRYRGAGGSIAAGEADRRADAVEVDRAVFRHACPAFFLVGWSRTSAGVISLLRASYERSSDDIGSTSGTGGASISGVASFRGKSNVKPLRYSREQSSSVSSNSRRDIRHTTQRSFVCSVVIGGPPMAYFRPFASVSRLATGHGPATSYQSSGNVACCSPLVSRVRTTGCSHR